MAKTAREDIIKELEQLPDEMKKNWSSSRMK